MILRCKLANFHKFSKNLTNFLTLFNPTLKQLIWGHGCNISNSNVCRQMFRALRSRCITSRIQYRLILIWARVPSSKRSSYGPGSCTKAKTATTITLVLLCLVLKPRKTSVFWRKKTVNTSWWNLWTFNSSDPSSKSNILLTFHPFIICVREPPE